MTLRQWLDPPINKIAYVVFTSGTKKPIQGMLNKKHLDATISSCDRWSVSDWNARARKRKWDEKIFNQKDYDWVWLIYLESIRKDDKND